MQYVIRMPTEAENCLL